MARREHDGQDRRAIEALLARERWTEVADLRALLRFLRSPEGCPWDREQTHASLRRHVLEESYELVDAIERGDDAELREELGDLLLQVVFQVQIAEEEGRFSFEDVVDGLVSKLIRRHSALFADDEAARPEDVNRLWERNKREEKGLTSHGELLRAVARALPALTRAEKLQRKAAQAGLDWEDVDGVRAKVDEELAELDALRREGGDRASLEAEFGDLLFTAVNYGRWLDIRDPEDALEACNRRFIARVEAVEALAQAEGMALEAASAEQLDRWWEAAKHLLAEREERDDENR